MAIRIYTLAKELKIDNKKLVDICTKAGITGKGSALASLTDEEEARLKAYLSGGEGAKGDGGAGASLRERPAWPGGAFAARTTLRRGHVGGKVPVLPSRPPERPPLARKKPRSPRQPHRRRQIVRVAPIAGPGAARSRFCRRRSSRSSPSCPQSSRRAAVAAAPPVPASPPGPPAAPAALPPLFRSPRGPSRGRRRSKTRAEKKPGEKKSRPGIHLAPMPASAKPAAKAKAKEPAPQKPDIKLPLDAIRAGKAGAKPLSEHIRKHEEKKREDLAAAKKGGRKAAPAGQPEVAAPTEALPRPRASAPRRPRRRRPTSEGKEPGLAPWAAASSGS